MHEEPLLSLRDALATVVNFLPALLSGVLVLLVGAALGWLAARLVTRVLLWLRIDRVAQRFRWGSALAKGDVRHTFVDLVGWTLGVLVFLIFLDRALTLWELTVLSQLLEHLVFLVPKLAVAAVILLAGAAIAAGSGRAVRRALLEEGVPRASLISRIVRGTLLSLAAAVALIQLDVAARLITYAFLVGFGALALTLVFAFGLGSRRAVEAMWESVRRENPPGADTEGDAG